MPFPYAGDLPNPGIEPRSLALQADSLPSEPPGKPLDELYNHEIKNECLNVTKGAVKF